MSPKREIRFAVGTRQHLVSSVWRLWGHGNNLYLAARTLARMMKTSFHESGICRIAIVSQAPREPIHRWNRGKRNLDGVTPLFSVVVPALSLSDHFQETLPQPDKEVHFVEAPISGTKLIFSMVATDLDVTRSDFENLARGVQVSLHGRVQLKRESVWLASYLDGMPAEEQHKIERLIESVKINLEPGSSAEGTQNAKFHHIGFTDPPSIWDLPLGPKNVFVER